MCVNYNIGCKQYWIIIIHNFRFFRQFQQQQTKYSLFSGWKNKPFKILLANLNCMKTQPDYVVTHNAHNIVVKSANIEDDY